MFWQYCIDALRELINDAAAPAWALVHFPVFSGAWIPAGLTDETSLLSSSEAEHLEPRAVWRLLHACRTEIVDGKLKTCPQGVNKCYKRYIQVHILPDSGCFSRAPFSPLTNSFPALSTVFLSAYFLQPRRVESFIFDRKMISRPCLCFLIKAINVFIALLLYIMCPVRKKHRLKYILHTTRLIWCMVYFCSIIVMKLIKFFFCRL